MANLDTLQSVGGYNLDNNSYPDFNNSVFNLFSNNQPTSEIKGKLNMVLRPERKITADTNIITYTMMPVPDKFLWPDSIRLVGKMVLEKKPKDATAWTTPLATDKVTVMNNPQQNLFSKVIIKLNDTEISDPSTDPYPYQSYFATTFNLNKDFKEHLHTQLFYKDTPNLFNAFKQNPDLHKDAITLKTFMATKQVKLGKWNEATSKFEQYNTTLFIKSNIQKGKDIKMDIC